MMAKKDGKVNPTSMPFLCAYSSLGPFRVTFDNGFDLIFVKADFSVWQNDVRNPPALGEPQRSARRVAEQEVNFSWF
jgi:hypothetical protein